MPHLRVSVARLLDSKACAEVRAFISGGRFTSTNLNACHVLPVTIISGEK